MTKKLVFSFLLASVILQAASAQIFLKPAWTFSDEKISYVTLKDGTEIQGYLRDLDRKKGLIEQVKIKDINGKKHKLKPDDIAYMYLPPSGWSKFMSSYDFLTDVNQWDNTDLNSDIIGKGYAYYEQSEVMIKKKKRSLLLQLLNPSFCSVIRVYHDPYAKETRSVGIGGMKLAGGDEKSYYIKKDKVAYKLKKKNYDEEFALLFKSCKAVITKYSKIKWSEFNKHVHDASKECKK